MVYFIPALLVILPWPGIMMASSGSMSYIFFRLLAGSRKYPSNNHGIVGLSAIKGLPAQNTFEDGSHTKRSAGDCAGLVLINSTILPPPRSITSLLFFAMVI